MRQIAGLLALIAVATTAGLGMSHLGAPLPWMIGPLVTTAFLTLSGLTTARIPTNLRPFGQIVVATFVGAHFTREAMQGLIATAPMLLAVSLWVLVVALIVAWLQSRLFGGRLVARFLAVVPTSPVEAVEMAERYGVATIPVILSQTLRIALVVTTIPFLLYHYASALEPVTVQAAIHMDGLSGAAIALAGAVAGPIVFRALNVPNPFFLGPLFMAAMISALDLPRYDLPDPVLAAAQIVLGTWLGCAFRPGLMKGRALGDALFSSGLLLIGCGLGAVALSALFDTPLATVVLGIAPGGVTEMALTAGILMQDVAMVTAMHITRIFVIMPNVGRITRLCDRLDPNQTAGRAGEDKP